MIEQVIISIIAAFVVSQIAKTIKNYQASGWWDWTTFFFQDGGMPSSHTATMIAMTTALLIETGLSYYFVIAALVSLIVMNDAMKARHELQEEAKIVNRLMAKTDIVHHKLTEKVGHTPIEVAAGFLVGVACSIIVYSV